MKRLSLFLPDDPLLEMLLGYNYLFAGRIEEGKKLLEKIRDITFDHAVSKEVTPADIVWGIVSVALFALALIGNLLTGFRFYKLKKYFLRRSLNIKRSFVCGVSLFVALFSPALGTMFACTYFLMYDKRGIEEIVPSVLQDQFREFLTPS